MSTFKSSDYLLICAPSVSAAEAAKKELGAENVEVVAEEDFSKLGSSSTRYDGILSITATTHTSQQLSSLSKLLKPGGLLVVREPKVQNKEKDIFMALTLAGFVDAKNTQTDSILEFVSAKPNWEIGSAQALPRNKKPKLEATSQTVTTAKVWSLTSDDITEEDLEDENSLLRDEDKAIPKNLKLDCETGPKRKACKNCSCGLAKLEVQNETKAQAPAKSSCGNCYLGDAFRCSTCPHLGKPAFKPGEEIKLDVDAIDI